MSSSTLIYKTDLQFKIFFSHLKNVLGLLLIGFRNTEVEKYKQFGKDKNI